MPPDDPDTPDTTDTNGQIDVTRRQAMKGALAFGAASTVVMDANLRESLAATNQISVSDTQNIHIQTQATNTDGLGNFPNPDTGEYILYGGDPLMTLKNYSKDINDDTIYATVHLQLNNGDFVQIGGLSKPLSQIPDPFHVSARDLWGTHPAWNESQDAVDMRTLAADKGIFDSYSDLTIPYDEPDTISSPIKKQTSFTFRYRFRSNTLEIDVQKTESFSLITSIILGFGESFGVNFGLKDIAHDAPFVESVINL